MEDASGEEYACTPRARKHKLLKYVEQPSEKVKSFDEEPAIRSRRPDKRKSVDLQDGPTTSSCPESDEVLDLKVTNIPKTPTASSSRRLRRSNDTFDAIVQQPRDAPEPSKNEIRAEPQQDFTPCIVDVRSEISESVDNPVAETAPPTQTASAFWMWTRPSCATRCGGGLGNVAAPLLSANACQ